MEFIAKTRSNYFHVKNEEEFVAFCKRLHLTPHVSSEDPSLKAILHHDTLPDDYDTENEDGDTVRVQIDFYKELAKHLVPGEIAVFVTISHEGMRSLSGQTVAVNSEGKTVWIDLDDIYDKARKELGGTVTQASH